MMYEISSSHRLLNLGCKSYTQIMRNTISQQPIITEKPSDPHLMSNWFGFASRIFYTLKPLLKPDEHNGARFKLYLMCIRSTTQRETTLYIPLSLSL